MLFLIYVCTFYTEINISIYLPDVTIFYFHGNLYRSTFVIIYFYQTLKKMFLPECKS